MVKNYLHFFYYIYHTKIFNFAHWAKEKFQQQLQISVQITEADFPSQIFIAGWQPYSMVANAKIKGWWARLNRAQA